ncbi:RloB family protein [Chryseobacterium indoltheticum]|uniref:RloB family protein n=1 Tax=Chryseobacterium indoltheticum TaxID=254 RepID=UPI0028F172C1|nr:RloB family protein [Chryseobacterium indoltheticum]
MPKKTKAKKITDIKAEKPWLRKTGNVTYKIDSREMKKTILIVCEGQSEELYFKSFPVVSCTVTAYGLGMTKDSLVEAAIQLKNEEDFDEVWCVFDMDINHGKREICAFDNAISKASKNNIMVAYSNDSFELWYCLHFEYFDQQHRREIYNEVLSKKLGINYTDEGKKYNYCKSIYSILNTNGSQKLAISRAKRLYKQQMSLVCSEQNPVTLVYQLVESLNKNIRN